MIGEILNLGKQIYDTSNPRELHRLIVFLGRSLIHYPAMKKLWLFFQEDEQRRKILEKNPFPMEQVTRAFFYAGSTFEERCELVHKHFEILQKKFCKKWVVLLGGFDGNYLVWDSAEKDIDWKTVLTFEPGQRKEGMMSLKMTLDKDDLYQMMFWFGYDNNDETVMWIGAMQGPNMEHARDIIKDITKRSHRYRTKNLILYMTQAVARSLKVRHIYAVSNEGYYAMNHMRSDRKLKTNFGAFWEECGGSLTADPRFYELPLTEQRKAMDEVPTRKRAVYRRRFAFQDDVDRQIAANMENILK